MTTRTTLEGRVGRRTGQVSASNFSTICYEAFDAVLKLASNSHTFQDMIFEESISITTGEYSYALPTDVQVGFESSVRSLYTAIGLEGSGATYSFDFKSLTWLNKHYPDRYRSSANTGRPRFAARIRSNLHLNCSADGSYTLRFCSIRRPDADLFTNGADSTINPIPSLDGALVHYAAAEVLADTGAVIESVAESQKFVEEYQAARRGDAEEPGIIFRAGVGSQSSFHPDPSTMDFNHDISVRGIDYGI